VAQRDFDNELARTLHALADRIDGRRAEVKAPEEWLAPLEHAVRVFDAAETQQKTRFDSKRSCLCTAELKA